MLKRVTHHKQWPCTNHIIYHAAVYRSHYEYRPYVTRLSVCLFRTGF